MPENNAFGGNERLGPQTIYKDAPISPLDILTVARDGKYYNYSNQVGDQYLSRGDLLDKIRAGSVNALGSFDTADKAYQAYMGLNPYSQYQDTVSSAVRIGGSAMPYQETIKYNKPNWASGWNPIFLPNTENIKQPQQQPTGTWDTPKPDGSQQQPVLGAQNPPPTAQPSQFAWGQNSWYNNALMGRDPYGEFSSRRGL